MLANLVNMLSIIVGGLIGIVFKRYIKKDIIDNLLKGVGLIIVVIAILGLVKSMVYFDDNILKSKNELLLLISLFFGVLIGEIINIDKALNKFVVHIEKKLNKDSLATSFINASIIFCIGAMGIIGSINAANGDGDILYLKALIDGVTSIALASSLGVGVLLASLSVVTYQGLIILLSNQLSSFLTAEFIDAFNAVGYAIVLCIGINFISKDKFKIANMLPSLFIVIIYFLLKRLF